MADQAEKLRKLTIASSGKQEGTIKQENMRVVTVASGKGGVGKTSVVVNLAIALSRAGKRVMVLDADLGMANVDIMLGIIPRYTLYDVFRGRKTLREIILNGPEKISVIPGGSGIHELANIGLSERDFLISQLKDFAKEVDFLLIDSGAGVSRNVLGFISAADDVIVVVTPEPTSITDAYGVIKILSKFKLHEKAYIVINRASDVKEARDTVRKLENVVNRFLDIRLNCLGFISDDSTVGKSVKEQKPFMITHAKSRAARETEYLAENLIKKGEQPPQGIDSFISKLMRLFK